MAFKILFLLENCNKVLFVYFIILLDVLENIIHHHVFFIYVNEHQLKPRLFMINDIIKKKET